MCKRVIQQAKEQGAAVIMGGDFNATAHVGQRASADKAVDRYCRQWIRDLQGTAAVSSRADNLRGVRSWQDPQGRYDADLDHMVAFPASIPMSSATSA